MRNEDSLRRFLRARTRLLPCRCPEHSHQVVLVTQNLRQAEETRDGMAGRLARGEADLKQLVDCSCGIAKRGLGIGLTTNRQRSVVYLHLRPEGTEACELCAG